MIKLEETGKNGGIGEFRFKSRESGTSKISISGEFYNGAGELLQTKFNDLEIQIEEENANAIVAQYEGNNLNNPNLNLENLAVENILLYPPFDPFVQNYNIEISNNTNALNILAVPENEQSKIQITGNGNLQEGNNTIVITVTSISGEKRDYIINSYKRNLQEEQIYLENKEKEREQLKEIYQTQELSTDNLDNENEKDIHEKSHEGIFVAIIFIGVGSIMIFKAYKKYY